MSLTALVQLIFTSLVVAWVIRVIFIVIVLSITYHYFRQYRQSKD